jgi:hypothetical protein
MMRAGFFTGLVGLLLTGSVARGGEIVVVDASGALGASRAPVTATVRLSGSERRAADQGRLRLVELTSPSSAPLPAQLFPTGDGGREDRICWLMPPGAKGKRTFKLQTIRRDTGAQVIAKSDAASGQFDITDAGQPVLRYNYATVEPGDILGQVAPNSRIYARARSDYIHPLFGLDGETLTKDFSVDHPHHRGIYWAWPEVDWRGNRGDLHALQHVFARPTGQCTTRSGPVFAQLTAENLWKWEDTNAVVREVAIIRAYRATDAGRLLDLEFQFTALDDPVLLARRATTHYGGLNIRLAKVDNQEIVFHTDPSNTVPRRVWAELSGTFAGALRPSGIVVLQNAANPDYPGEWVQYPNLNWFQPTFPAAGTRFESRPGLPLVLRFRLWLHRGGKTSDENCAAQWQAYQHPSAPEFFPVSARLKRPSSS